MLMAFVTLISGLLISGVAIFYSVAGLTSIFSAAPIPIMVMGVSLELAKLVATLWLKKNWHIAPTLLKTYLMAAVALLMVITSLGCFGYLSKAHSDQSLVSGDVQSKLAIYDQKIQTAKDNIESDRKSLQQMDAAVDQTLSRSTNVRGANNAVSIRKSQTSERSRINSEIQTNQDIITKLGDESAPTRALSRKVEAEVGPIKYIAQLVYGPNPSENILEKAVSWMIILIVVVFDPLAITLLLASQYSFAQLAEEKRLRNMPVTLEQPITSEPEKYHENIIPVPEEILQESDGPVDRQVQSDIDRQLAEIEEDEQPEQEFHPHAEVTEPTSEVKITHTAEGMTIEDSAGTQTISTQAGYVQNEEQQESSVWSSILKPISEREYMEAAKRKQDEQ